MDATERNGKLIAHAASKRARLGEAEMVRIAGGAATHETGLSCDKPTVFLVAQPDASLQGRSAVGLREWRDLGSTGSV